MLCKAIVAREYVEWIVLVLLPFDVVTGLLHCMVRRDRQTLLFDSMHHFAVGLPIGATKVGVLVPTPIFWMFVAMVVVELMAASRGGATRSSTVFVDLSDFQQIEKTDVRYEGTWDFKDRGNWRWQEAKGEREDSYWTRKIDDIHLRFC